MTWLDNCCVINTKKLWYFSCDYIMASPDLVHDIAMLITRRETYFCQTHDLFWMAVDIQCSLHNVTDHAATLETPLRKLKVFFVIFKSFIYWNVKRSHKTVTSIRLFKNAKMNINTQPPKNMLLNVPSKFAKASAIFLTACCVESGSFVSFMSCPLNIRKF